jgi:flagellar biosynthesis regulator FlbT
MKVIKKLFALFKQDEYTKSIKNNLKQIDKKIARSKSYDEIVLLTKEYNLLEKKLKQYENQTN